MSPSFDQLYQGFTLPLLRGAEGVWSLHGSREVIRSHLRMILLTRIGERRMLPEFGSRLYELVGEFNDTVLAGLAVIYVVEPIKRWTNLVRVTSVQTSREEHQLNLRIHYVEVQTQQPDLLVLSLPTAA